MDYGLSTNQNTTETGKMASFTHMQYIDGLWAINEPETLLKMAKWPVLHTWPLVDGLPLFVWP